MSVPAVSLVDQIRALAQAAKVSFDQSTAPAAGDPTREELMARLEAATDNNTRWNLADALDKLPVKRAF